MPQTQTRKKPSKGNKGSKAKKNEQKSRKPTDPLEVQAQAALKRLQAKDPGLKQFLKDAYGYAVFPNVGKAALVLGGAYGRGVVFEQGEMIGYATIGQFTIGVQIGGDTFAELVVFKDEDALERFKQGKVRFAANASAVLVKAGAAATADYEKGVTVFAYASGGMLLEAAIGGQKFNFKKQGEQEQQGAEGKDDEQQEGDGQGRGGIMGLVSGGAGMIGKTASKTGGLVKNHPIAATLFGAGIAWLAMKALREGGYFDGDDQGEGNQQDDDSDAEKSGSSRGRAYA
jgi:lipid-binding SYLF domain-containing protein